MFSGSTHEVAAGIASAITSVLPNAVAEDAPPRSISPTIVYNRQTGPVAEAYRFPRIDPEALQPRQGVRAFQLLCSLPRKSTPLPENQWATLISIILANGPRLQRDPTPIQLEDHQQKSTAGQETLLSTYYISQLDAGLYCAIVVERQKANSKSAIEYLRSTAVSMRQSSFLEYLLSPK